MDLEPYYILAALALAWIIAYFVGRRLSKYGVEAHPLYMLLRTTRLNRFMERMSNHSILTWKVVFSIGIAISLGLAIYAVQFMAENLYRYFYRPETADKVFLLIPGVTIRLESLPYLLVSAGLAILPHELAHGVSAVAEGIPLQDSGIVLSPLTFGAFVEHKEEQFKSAKRTSKLRVVGAGSLANLVLGVITILITTAAFLPASGVIVESVKEGGPVFRAGMRDYEVIYRMNDTEIRQVSDLLKYLFKVRPGDKIFLVSSTGARNIMAEASQLNVSRGVIGIVDFSDYHPLRLGEINPRLSYTLLLLSTWYSTISISLAMFNMMPLNPLDGGRLMDILSERTGRYARLIRLMTTALSIMLIGGNIVLTYLRYGLVAL